MLELFMILVVFTKDSIKIVSFLALVLQILMMEEKKLVTGMIILMAMEDGLNQIIIYTKAFLSMIN